MMEKVLKDLKCLLHEVGLGRGLVFFRKSLMDPLLLKSCLFKTLTKTKNFFLDKQMSPGQPVKRPHHLPNPMNVPHSAFPTGLVNLCQSIYSTYSIEHLLYTRN